MREARKPEEQIQTVLREGEDNSQKEEQVRAQEDLEGNIPEEEEKLEPAEDFVPNGMILVSGAEAVLDVVQGVSYDVSSGSVTWQTVEFADHYQVDVVDSVTGKEVLSVTSKTGQISLAQHDFITDRGYKIQVTAHSENRISLAGTTKGEDASFAAKSDEYFMDDEHVWYYYYRFACSQPVAISAVMSPAYTGSVTAVTEISAKRLANGYYEFQVLPVKMQETEYIRVEYSNNKNFKNSGSSFAYEAKAAGNMILQSVRAGDGHTTKGYHRYQAAEHTYRADISCFLPGDTIYIRARIYNSAYRLEESQPAEGKFSPYKTFTYKLPDVEMGMVDTSVTTDSTTLRPSVESGWVTGYEFQKKINGTWVKLAKQTGNISYKDSGLLKGTSYSYRVRGYVYNRLKKRTVYTSWQKASVYTWGSALRLKAEAKGTDSVKLTWKKYRTLTVIKFIVAIP